MLPREFYLQAPREAAVRLLGCELVWNGAAGRIVEVEAYESIGDPACHTFFRRGAREFVERNPPGTAYVYLNYGVHWLFNILVKCPATGVEGFVLVRALEPTRGVEEMRVRRGRDLEAHLCSGPGKLTQALGILGSDHGADLCATPERAIAAGALEGQAVLADVRIGISKAQDFLWRYLVAGSPCLSVKPTKAAAALPQIPPKPLN